MTYTCSMHPEVKSDKPGKCSICNMNLIDSEKSKGKSQNEEQGSYTPLFTILGLILLTSLVVAWSHLTVQNLIQTFMIGFFLVFGGFKFIDLKGFAQAYSMYDLLAKRVSFYGYLYPFIELFFGLSMIINPFSRFILLSEVIVMTFSGLGVAIKLAKKEKFQCVCLGTAIKLPLTTVTLIEDFGMALLALTLLIFA